MTIRTSAYNTTATSNISIVDTINKLKSITSDLNEDVKNIFTVTGSTSFQEHIPTFIFPIVGNMGSENVVFIDARSFGSYNINSGAYVVKQVEQLEALRLQASLALSWSLGRQGSIEYLSPLPMAIFVTWIAESIAKRMNLSGRDQYIVTILAAILYYNSFREGNLESDDDRSILFNIVTRNLKYSDSSINEMLIKEYGWINDVNDFCKATFEATQSVAVKNLNVAILYTLISGSMWGAHAAEKLAVALEYPPTWITLIYQIITDRSYRGRCQLSTIAERSMYKKYRDDFVRKCLICIEGGI